MAAHAPDAAGHVLPSSQPIIVREQKSVGQQVGNGIATFGLIVIVFFMVMGLLAMVASA